MTTQARELAKIVTNAGDVNLGDDISLASDGAILNFGADSDVTLTHVADTGLLLNSSRQIQFGDSGTYIRQSADAVLQLTSDTEVEINATTVDINANVDISGNLVLGGNITIGDADSDDISFGGELTSHIVPNADDTYDLGSASKQWRNLYVDGSAYIDTIDGTDETTITNTDTGSSAGPIVSLYRNSSSAADADYLGQFKFQGENDADQQVNYAKITGKILDASDGSEDGILEFAHIKAGSQTITGRWRSDSLQLLNGTNFSVAGTLDVTGETTLASHLNMGDGDTIKLGDSVGDFELYHIADSINVIRGSGGLVLQTDDTSYGIQMGTYSGGETMFKAIKNGAVELYYDNNKVLETQSGALQISSHGTGGTLNLFSDSGTSEGQFNITYLTDGSSAAHSVAEIRMQQGSGDGSARKGEILFRVSDNGGPATAMTIQNNLNIAIPGSLFVDTTTDNSVSNDEGVAVTKDGTIVVRRAATMLYMHHTAGSGTGTLVAINKAQSTVGTITATNSNAAYNTSSDYRLKENVDYTWDATTRLKQLKPARFNWIADETNTLQDGFMAHEVENIVPEAVTGTKDAVWSAEEEANGEGIEGQIKGQQMDHSKLVPLLVKTVQELEARIATLEG